MFRFFFVQLVLSIFSLMALVYSQQYTVESPYFVQQGYDTRLLEPTLDGAYGGPAISSHGLALGSWVGNGGYGGYGGYYKR